MLIYTACLSALHAYLRCMLICAACLSTQLAFLRSLLICAACFSVQHFAYPAGPPQIISGKFCRRCVCAHAAGSSLLLCMPEPACRRQFTIICYRFSARLTPCALRLLLSGSRRLQSKGRVFRRGRCPSCRCRAHPRSRGRLPRRSGQERPGSPQGILRKM